LALRPAFDEKERNRLIKQVTTTEPRRLERLNPAIPRDLVTIIHKAIAKEASRRYQTAGELAADLQRFVDDRPIQARRVSTAERAWRWCRRNPLVAALTAAVAFLLVAGTMVATYYAIDANAKAKEALGEKTRADREADAAWANQYIAHANLMQNDWENANVGRIRDTLALDHPPPPGRKDLRGWEWHYQERLCSQDLRTLQW